MKKIIALVLVILMLLSFAACSKDPNLGKYSYVSGSMEGTESDWIELKKGGKGTFFSGFEFDMKWTLSGENFTGTVTFLGMEQSMEGTLKDGVLTVSYGDIDYVFAKDGAELPADQPAQEAPESEPEAAPAEPEAAPAEPEAAPAEPEAAPAEPEAAPVETGETFNAGNFSVGVPDGWKAFAVADIFAEEDDAVDPNAIQIGKGAETDWDLFSVPYLDIRYYGPDSELWPPTKDWYDDAEDIASFQAGKYTWEGFSATSYDTPVTILWAIDGDHEYQVSIMTGTDENNTVTATDADVQAILASLQPAA